jgi:beta-lactamase regulating signal transducer with metallopeptidase domain
MGDPALLLLTNAGTAGLIALLAWAASRVTRRHAIVHGLWLLALVKLLTPPIAPLPLLPAWAGLSLVPERPSPAVVTIAPLAAGDAIAPTPTSTEPSSIQLRPALDASPTAPALRIDGWTVVWGLLVTTALGVVALAGWRFVRFGRLLACARPAPPSLADRSSALAARLGLRRAPPVRLVPGRFPPMLWPARGGPLVLLPERLARDLRAAELDALLVHELAHVRRRDHWVRLLEIAATALFWWYPVTWWARRALRRAEERCCDEWVLRLLPDSAEAYANGLLKSLTFVSESPVPAMASGLGPVGDLEARLKEILMTRPVPRLAVPLRLALAAAATLGLAVFPTHAQSNAQAEEPATPAATAETDIPLPPARPAAPAPAPMPPPAPVTTGTVSPQADQAPAPIVPTTGHREPEAGDRDDDERRAIEQHRLQLRRQQLELEQKKAQVDAQAQEAELRAMADRLRAEGKAREAVHIEKQIELNARRLELQQRQLQLEAERAELEARLEAETRSRQERLEAFQEQARREASARRRMEEAEEAHRLTEQEVRRRQHALQADLVAAQERLERAVAAEDPTRAIRAATAGLVRALARQIEAFEQAASETPARKQQLDPEIRRLKAALDALKH